MKINITADIPDRWVDHFCSMLRYMEYCGHVGHSALIGFYADGDGDFRPEFEFNNKYNDVPGNAPNGKVPEMIFDAG